jgi:hypothetical protein
LTVVSTGRSAVVVMNPPGRCGVHRAIVVGDVAC